MSCDIFSLRSTFLFFLRIALILASVAYLGLGARAQEAQPTPSATPPTASVEVSPTPQVSPTPLTVQDSQKVQPENLQGVPQIAPTYHYEDRSLPDLGRVGVDLMQQRSLSLREALELALSNNKDIEVARQNTRISEFDLGAARGVFELRSFVQTLYENSTTPSSSTIIGGPSGKLTTSNFAANANLTVLEPKYGGNFTAQFNNSRGTNTSIVNTLNPQFLTNLNLQYTQPLFRGRRFDQNRRQIEVAKKNLSLNDLQFRQRTIEVITNVQRAYWDLTFSLKNLQVQRDAVRDARDQLEHNQRLVNEGLLAPIDVTAVETQVANYEQSVYDALNTVSQSENTLKNLIAQNRSDDLWTASLIPTDAIEIDPPSVTLPDALTEALANRPELEQNKVSQEINQIDQRYFREQTKPQIDLIANYNLAGLAGTELLGGTSIFNNGQTTTSLNQVIGQVNQINGSLPDIPFVPITAATRVPDNLTGGFFSSLGNLFALRYPTYRVGVQFNLPFESRTAKAQFGRSLVEGERVVTQRAQLEQSVQVDVRNALQLIRTSQARLRSAAIARDNSEKQYSSEQRKLDAGQSTVFLVLDRQTALTTARGNELRAQTELNKAIADLQRATGNSLRANNIVANLK
jgi:HAE1 family hydrophobic/amphiphilic exporter-1